MQKPQNLILSILLILTLNLSCIEKEEAAEEEKAGEKSLSADSKDNTIRLTEKSFKRMGLTVEKAETKYLPSFIDTTAEIQFNANKLFRIKPRVQGRVVEIFADFGQEVTAGEKLVILDSVELAKAWASYRATKAKAEVALSTYEREKRLWEKKVSSEREMLAAKGEYLSLVADLEKAREELHLLGVSDEDIELLLTDRMSTFPLVSPFNGTVVDKKVTLGEVVEPTDTLFTVANLDVMWIFSDIYEKDLSEVKLGQYAEILVKACPHEKFPGKITYIGYTVDEKTRTVKIRVEADNKDRRLKAGMFANVRIYLDGSEKASRLLLVPSVATQRYAERKVVFVKKGDYTFEVRPVETGRELEGFTEVVSGLKEGEEVVTKGSFYLKSEMLKETLEAEE